MGAVISASAHRDSETNEYDVRNMEIGRSKWPANDASANLALPDQRASAPLAMISAGSSVEKGS